MADEGGAPVELRVGGRAAAEDDPAAIEPSSGGYTRKAGGRTTTARGGEVRAASRYTLLRSGRTPR